MNCNIWHMYTLHVDQLASQYQHSYIMLNSSGLNDILFLEYYVLSMQIIIHKPPPSRNMHAQPLQREVCSSEGWVECGGADREPGWAARPPHPVRDQELGHRRAAAGALLADGGVPCPVLPAAGQSGDLARRRPGELLVSIFQIL